MEFLYIPADGENDEQWLVPENTTLISGTAGGLAVFVVGSREPIAIFHGKQAGVLRRHLSGRHLSDRIHPELPRIPAKQFEKHYERQAFVGGISDGEYFDRHTEGEGADA